jgi:hypothetical protein
MKKTTFLSLLMFMGLALFTACGGDGQLHNVRGIVKHVRPNNDSIPLMTIGIEDGDTLVFSLAEARFQNGTIIPNDSVIIDFIEGKDYLRALVVTVLPRTYKPAVLKHDSIYTAPADSTQAGPQAVPIPQKK